MNMTNESNDKELHDFFRQSLDDYQPQGSPEVDWERLYPKINQKPNGIWWFWGGLALCIFVILGSILYFKSTDNQIVIVKKYQTKMNIVRPSNKGIELKNFTKERIFILPKSRSLTIVFPKKNEKVRRYIEEFNLEKGEGEKSYLHPISMLSTMRPPRKLMIESGFLLPQIIKIIPEENDFTLKMLKEDFGNDSTMYQLLGRKIKEWNNSVIVSDFTTSMYPYSTQVFAWMKKNPYDLAINGTVFFTDCDSLGNQTQKGGNAGQMFLTKDRNLTSILPIMLKADQNTQNNRDGEENDIEALLYAQKNFPEAQHLILIADNEAPPKDMYLLSQIIKPVHVVLCGTTRDTTKAFQNEYFEIATKTGGSLHTLEDDIDPQNLSKNTWIKIGNYLYRYHPRRQKFKVTNFKNRPK